MLPGQTDHPARGGIGFDDPVGRGVDDHQAALEGLEDRLDFPFARTQFLLRPDTFGDVPHRADHTPGLPVGIPIDHLPAEEVMAVDARFHAHAGLAFVNRGDAVEVCPHGLLGTGQVLRVDDAPQELDGLRDIFPRIAELSDPLGAEMDNAGF